MQLTRQQIIDYLQTNRLATSIELSRALKVTSANIRHHLKILSTAGEVEVIGKQPNRGRGRPKKIYRLTEKALQHNLEGLANALLKTLLSDNPSAEKKISKLAKHLSGDFKVVSNIHTRFNLAIEHLNQLEYQAAWEASPIGPRVIFRNCPYAVLVAENPELCQMDKVLLTRILGQQIQQTAKLERSPDGIPHCIFITR